MLRLILVLLKEVAALRFWEDQIGLVSGNVLGANEEIEGKDRAEVNLTEVVCSSLREYPLNKPGGLLATVYKGEKDGGVAQG